MNMNKKLSEMSLEELWELFPIFLTEHQTCWNEWYAEEEMILKRVIPQAERISHIGSTAIGFIQAKPIIDILAEVPRGCELADQKEFVENSGYLCMAQGTDRMSFNKGYAENGFAEKVFHLHVRYAGDNDELYFRDYLLEHPDVAEEYEKMKLKLWKKYEHDRDGYTNAKREFVKKYSDEARVLYGDRY